MHDCMMFASTLWVVPDLHLLQACEADAILLQVEGNLIKWQKWQIRTSFNYREGLVLHNVG